MVHNTKLIHFEIHGGAYGNLIAIESGKGIPFEIARVYYIFGVENKVRRGFHSHINLYQILICVSGNVKIEISNPFEKEIVELNHPSEGLLIGPFVWREMFDFSDNSVLLVLANEHFCEEDYIRDYEVYRDLAKEYFERLEI